MLIDSEPGKVSLTTEGHNALVAILTDGDVFEACLVERFGDVE